MMDLEKKLCSNAKRQSAYRLRQLDSERVVLRVWLSFEARRNLEALAFKRRTTLEKTIEQAINGEWETAGRP